MNGARQCFEREHLFVSTYGCCSCSSEIGSCIEYFEIARNDRVRTLRFIRRPSCFCKGLKQNSLASSELFLLFNASGLRAVNSLNRTSLFRFGYRVGSSFYLLRKAFVSLTCLVPVRGCGECPLIAKDYQ